MRLLSGLYTSRESLLAHGGALANVADNVANSNTVAYKRQRAEFENLAADFTGSLFGSPLQGGNGVGVTAYQTDFARQGSIEVTSNDLDVAIDGSGFFIVREGEENLYTRAGNFSVDTEGFLSTLTGHRLLGYTPESPTTLVELNLNAFEELGRATSEIVLGGNLNVTDPVQDIPGELNTFRDLTAASQFDTTIDIVDSLGVEHRTYLHFFHTAQSEWTVQAYTDGEEVGGEAGQPVLLGTGAITFNEFGTQDAGLELNLTPAWANGSAAGQVNIDFSSFTGLNRASAITQNENDGIVPGLPMSFVFAEDGALRAALTNGQEVDIAQVALAQFRNVHGLNSIGDNLYRASDKAGDPLVGIAGQDGRGFMQDNSLEQSNVDLSTEFVDMIKYQQAYQASSRMLQTTSEVIKSTIQIA